MTLQIQQFRINVCGLIVYPHSEILTKSDDSGLFMVKLKSGHGYIIDNSAADCLISVKSDTDFDYVTLDVLQMSRSQRDITY